MSMLPRYVMVQCLGCRQLLRVPQMVEPTLDGNLLIRPSAPHRCSPTVAAHFEIHVEDAK